MKSKVDISVLCLICFLLKGDMGSKAPSWADQWGTGSFGDSKDDEKSVTKKEGGNNKKMAEAKAAASAGYDKAKGAALVGADKAKAAAVVGALKLKSGTSMGIKWVKDQYQKRTSK